MPITFTPIEKNPEWSGCSWKIESIDELAQLIARVALGQSRYSLRILKETGFIGPRAATSTLTGALKLLTATDPTKPFHRDGWIFQVISWIAAHLQDPSGMIMEPHMIHAHKGFDGVHIRMNGTKVGSVVICEEKATKNPKKMIHESVWREFESFQKGESDHRLLSEVLVILRNCKGIDVDEAIEEIIWNDARAYRVAITIADENIEDIFDGYTKIVDGDVSRRRSEVLALKSLRPWMADLAERARMHAVKIADSYV